MIFIRFTETVLTILASFVFLDRKENMEEVTDGILRKADLPIVRNNKCHQYLDMTSNSASDYPGFLCAGGVGKEERDTGSF